ncbi:MAG: M28 family peptidase [Actinomycetota bacterium]|nr:M28 family peptidase [Actinomycetota bacterium]
MEWDKSKGLSDHKPFEKKGIPSAIVEWGKDPYYHTPKDTFDRIKSENIEITGKTLLEFLLNLEEGKL